jgi:hypothetical protein
MKSIRKIKFEATPIATRLMHDWINEALRCGGINSLHSDIYRKTIPEGKYSNQIASFVSELLADQQSSLIASGFPAFTSNDRSNHFLEQLRDLSQERLETVLYSYLVYEIEINEIELREIARKLTLIRNTKIKTEQEKVIFDQDGLEYFRLKRKLEETANSPVFAQITWDLYPKKPFSRKYSVLCKSILNLIKK